MSIINNRYRIVRQRNVVHPQVSSYLTRDMADDNKERVVHLLDGDFLPNAVGFYSKEFALYKNINHHSILKNYDLELVRFIGDKPATTTQYLISAEFAPDAAPLSGAAVYLKLKPNQVLDTFVCLCRAVGYLHSKNIIHGNIHANTVFINHTGNRMGLIDMAMTNLFFKDKADIYFQAPEILAGGEASVKGDIYALGATLFYLISGKSGVVNFKKELEEFTMATKPAMQAFLPIIQKATEKAENRFETVPQLIEALNSAFNKTFATIEVDELRHLMLGADFIGRHSQLDTIIKNFDEVAVGKSRARYVYISGVQGIGKSTIVGQLKNHLSLQNAPIFASFDSRGDNAMRTILRQMLDLHTSKAYDGDFLQYITAVANGTSLEGSTKSYGQSSIMRFMYDRVKDVPAMIILDDIEFADFSTIELFQRLAAICKNLCLVLSTRPDFENTKLTEFFASLTDENLITLTLDNLTKDETARLAKSILAADEVSDQFADVLHKNTGGNPLFVEEALKSLMLNGTIYINSENGYWYADYEREDFYKIPIPQNLMDAVKNVADALEGDEYRVVQAISVFDKILPTADMLASILQTDATEQLASLSKQGTLTVHSTGIGRATTYAITNKALNQVAYDQTSEEEAKKLHIRAADVLIGEKTQTDAMMEEIVYHLGVADDNRRLLEWLEKIGDAHYKVLNMPKSIEIYEKAIKICGLLGDGEKEIDVRLKLRPAQRVTNLVSKAIENMEKTADMAKDLGLIEKHIRAASSLINLHVVLSNLEAAKAVAAKVKPFFEDEAFRQKYLKAYVVFRYSSFDLLLTDAKEMPKGIADEKAGEELRRLQALCQEDWLEERITIADYINRHHSLLGEYAKCAEILTEAIEMCRKSGDTRLESVFLSNLAINHIHTGQGKLGYQMGMEQLSSGFTQPNLKMELVMILAICDYVFFFRVDDALMKLKEAQNEGMLMGLDIYTSDNIITVQSVMLERSMFTQIHGFAELYLEALEAGGMLANSHKQAAYVVLGRCYLMMGDLEKAKQLTAIFSNWIKERGVLSEHKHTALLTETVYDILMGNPSEMDANQLAEETIKQYLAEGSHIWMHKMGEAVDFAFILHQYGHKIPAATILTRVLEMADGIENISDFMRLKTLYAQSLLSESGEEAADYLVRAQQIAARHEHYLMLAIICRDLSLIYTEKAPYVATDYAVRACEAVQNLLNNTPPQFWASIMRFHGLLSIFKDVVEIDEQNPDFDIIMSPDIFDGLLEDENLARAKKDSFLSRMPSGMKDAGGIIRNLSSTSNDNLMLLARYFAAVACAPKCFIVVEDDGAETGFSIIADNDGHRHEVETKSILRHTKALGQDVFATVEGDNMAILPEGAKVAMCLPIDHNAYILIYTDSIFHNINEDAVAEIKTLQKPLEMSVLMNVTKAQSMLDKLTGALNRRYLDLALENSVAKTLEAGLPLSLIIADLDNFKGINDTYGHTVGDEVLTAVGKIIREHLRKDTPFGRFGGEEFMIALENVCEEDALKLAEKLRTSIEEARILGSKRAVTASFGIAVMPAHTQNKKELIDKADKALYASKYEGRNMSTVYREDLEAPSKNKHQTNDIITGDALVDAMRMRLTLEIIQLTRSEMTSENRKNVAQDKIKQMVDAGDHINQEALNALNALVEAM
ncbi:MAG: diguanylate cyclase [Defluviitaleaceae bacterium]|nr:diguanylate cyclase [Defluviitaleaceae bacterium]